MAGKEIYLRSDEQARLQAIIKVGGRNAHAITRARVLLMLDRTGKPPVSYKRTAEAAGISVQAVYNMRDDYLRSRNLDYYLIRKKRKTPPVAPKLDAEAAEKILALARGKPPEGHARWTVRLLTQQAAAQYCPDGLSHMTVQRLLKKRNITLT